MSRRPTIRDLAAAANVSVATVDRILNSRHPVREVTAQRVIEVAAQLGYHAAPLLRQRLVQELPSCRLGFLFQPNVQDFYHALADKIEAATRGTSTARVNVRVDYAPLASPAELIEKLQYLARDCQAIALVAQDYPALGTAIEELQARGIPIFTLLSDVALDRRAGYIGLNNSKVGRTAAWFIAKTVREPRGKVACFVGSHRYHGHEAREIALRSYFRECAPDFNVVETLINLDAPALTHEATLHLLKQHPDLVGICVSGGGGEGAISAIREARPEKKLTVVVNEITPVSRAALAEDIVSLVMSTPLQKLAETTVSLMVKTIMEPDAPPPNATILPFDIYCPENI